VSETLPVIAVFGASGLIGEAVARHLFREGFPVRAIARRFSPSQKAAFGADAVECEFVSLDTNALNGLLNDLDAEIVVNCTGVLQDGPRGDTRIAHAGFVRTLLAALGHRSRLLIHLSIPGNAADDVTDFSRTKREAERLITSSGVPFVILRAGFVLTTSAYGGSALMRALAQLPVRLPKPLADAPFAVTAASDLSRTIAFAARRWQDNERVWNEVWDVMERHPSSVSEVLDVLRSHFGGSTPRLMLPPFLAVLGAVAGDLISYLGWSPPVRTTALRELRRGVVGDPTSWITVTGIEPAPVGAIVADLPSTVQERWFGRLYLAKPLIIGCLAVFWVISGLIVLTISFDAAAGILVSHGFSPWLAKAVTGITSVVDILVGLAIAYRSTCRAGCVVGILVSLGYMIAATVLAPGLWFDPLGVLVKIIPATVLKIVVLTLLGVR